MKLNCTRYPRLAMLAAAGVLLAACGGGSDGPAPTPPPPTVTVARVDVTPTRVSLQPGGAVDLSAVARDAAGNPITTGVTLTWQSSNAAVATITGSRATAVANGTAEITAVANGTRSAAVPVRVAAPASGQQLIAAALAAGTIDANTAIKYRVFAAFNDPRLPFEFVGNERPRYDNTIAFDLSLAFEGMSAADQAEVAPFFLPPIYADSWLGKRRARAVSAAGAMSAQTAAGRVRAFVNDRPAPCSGIIDAGWTPHDSVNFRIWYDAAAHPTDAAAAVTVAAAAEDAYFGLRALGLRTPVPDASPTRICFGGDGRVDIYMVEQGEFGTSNSILGVATVIDGRSATSPAFIVINRSKVGTPEFYGTVVHEYMHVVQAAYPNHLAMSNLEIEFFKDATADWAIDYVKSTDNGEHSSAAGLLNGMESPLWASSRSSKRYGAYLFFQFATRVGNANGNDYGGPAVVRNFWEGVAAQPAGSINGLAVLNAALPRGLTATWNDFAAAAWNQGPVNRFELVDGLTQTPPADRSIAVNLASTPSAITPAPAFGSDSTLEYPMPELSARYERFTFAGDSASTVTFFNGYTYGLQTETVPLLNPLFNPPLTLQAGRTLAAFTPTPQERAGRALTALIRIGGQWTVENWTDRPIRFFCREKNAERVEEIVLVFSNGAYTNTRAPAREDDNAVTSVFAAPSGLSSRFISSKMPCHQFQGTASGSTTVTGNGNNFTITNSVIATLRGRPALFSGQLRGRAVTLLPGVAFETTAGTLNSALTGVVAGCRATPFNETAAPSALPNGQQTPSFQLLTNYLPDATAHSGYAGAGGRSFFGLDPTVCSGGRSVDTPAPAAYDFDALWNAPVIDSIFKVDLANRRLRAADIEGPTAFTGSFAAPLVSKSSWCFVATREGESVPAGICP